MRNVVIPLLLSSSTTPAVTGVAEAGVPQVQCQPRLCNKNLPQKKPQNPRLCSRDLCGFLVLTAVVFSVIPKELLTIWDIKGCTPISPPQGMWFIVGPVTLPLLTHCVLSDVLAGVCLLVYYISAESSVHFLIAAAPRSAIVSIVIIYTQKKYPKIIYTQSILCFLHMRKCLYDLYDY